jgi:RNA polymerase-interacting CarD/CdnL/TRCF family regulator
MIRAGQKSIDPEEKRLATILLDEYDNYLLNVPKSDIAAGDVKAAGKTWEEARNAYSRMKKSEVFEDMLAEAKLDRSKFTQSGEENSLAKQLRQLAKNDKKMRLFTAEERKAITKAAEGDSMQNLLKFFGRFAPTGPVSGLFTGGVSVMAPAVGIPLAAGAAASRMAATNMRRGSVEDLTNMMRLGQTPQIVGGRLRTVPATTMGGLLSIQDLDEQQRNLMGIQ